MTMAGVLRRCPIAVALVAILPACDEEPPSRGALAADRVTTTGKVSRVDCSDHGSVYYAFSAGAQQYGGKAPSRALDCATVKVGDPVIVYYAPLEPASSTVLALAGTRVPR